MPVTHIHLIRHGETTWNSDGRWQGHIDTTLSERGHVQARALGEFLRGQPISDIYSSDLQRARVTAEIIGAAIGVQVQTDIRWRELHLGVLQGLTKAEIEARYPHELQGTRDNWLDHRIQGGESRRAAQSRAIAALEEIVARAQGPEVAIVTHGGIVRVVLQRYFGSHIESMHKSIENTSLTTLRKTERGWDIERLAETPHLTPHAPQPPGEAQ